jgi:DNA polymerase III epsilon subunit-like protein
MSLQLTMNFKKHLWAAPSEFKDLSGYDEIAIDLETRDDGINENLGAGWASGRGEIIGFAVAVEGWQGYFPFGHFGGGNLIPDQVKNYMKDICELPCTKIFHNAQYDVGWLKASGITVNGQIVDTMIAAALINENRWSYSLNALSVDYLGEIKAESDLKEAAASHGVDAKSEMWKLPAEHVGHYAEQDARLTLLLWQRFKTEIRTQSLETIWKLESDLLPILIQMRFEGIKVNLEKAEQLKKEFAEQEKKLLHKIKKLVGKEVDIWAARQIGEAFDKLGIEYPRTQKTKEPSFTLFLVGYLCLAQIYNNYHQETKSLLQRLEVYLCLTMAVSGVLLITRNKNHDLLCTMPLQLVKVMKDQMNWLKLMQMLRLTFIKPLLI